jgi:hypothetical protein
LHFFLVITDKPASPFVFLEEGKFAEKAVQELIYNLEFGRIFGASRQKPGFSLQSFGCAKRISAAIPCAPMGWPLATLVARPCIPGLQDIEQAFRTGEAPRPGRA